MATEIDTGVGLISASESPNGSAIPCLGSCQVQGAIASAASIALLVNAIAYCENGITLMSTSASVRPAVCEDLSDLVGGDRARPIGGDGLALELL